MSAFYSLSSSSARHQLGGEHRRISGRRLSTTGNTFVFAGYQAISPQTKLTPRIELRFIVLKSPKHTQQMKRAFMNGNFLFTVTLLTYLHENDWWF